MLYSARQDFFSLFVSVYEARSKLCIVVYSPAFACAVLCEICSKVFLLMWCLLLIVSVLP